MITVGIGKAYHDCSICVNVDGVVKYAKWERQVQDKHAKAPDWWFWQKLSDWNIPFDQIDLIVETDGGGVSNFHKITRLPYGGNTSIRKNKKHFILDHHLAHVWSISSYNNDNAVVIDGKGSGDHTVMVKNNDNITRLKCSNPAHIFDNIGKILNLGSKHTDYAGKVMGLIPYGKPVKEVFDLLKKISSNNLSDCLKCVNIGTNSPPDEKSCFDDDWIKRLNAISTVNEICYDFVKLQFSSLDKSKPVYYSGGVALNVDWNRRLLDDGYNLIVEPASYDGGLSIGCMRYACYMLKVDQPVIKDFPYIQDDEAPDSTPSISTIKKVAEMLANGKIVGWYQGHGELGPRALGNRSILMNPTIKDGKDILNSKVKRREWFRPFGASVKKDKASKYFDLDENPYMLFTANVIDKNLPAITHVDGTCRHQTVTVESNRLFYSLLDEFESLTGLPVLLNTSLNLGGKPIAGRIQDAIELFNTTEMDALCVGDTLYIK